MKSFDDGIQIRTYEENDCVEAKKLFRDGLMSHIKGELVWLKLVFEKYVDETIVLYNDVDEMVHAENGGRLFVAVNGTNEVVGTAGLVVTDCDAAKRRAEMMRMTVRSDTQRQGVGRRLLEVLLEYAKDELKCESVHLDTVEAFVAANRLYKKVGFILKEIQEVEVERNRVFRIVLYEKRFTGKT